MQASDRLHMYLEHSQDFINQNIWEQRMDIGVFLQFLLKGLWVETIKLDLVVYSRLNITWNR